MLRLLVEEFMQVGHLLDARLNESYVSKVVETYKPPKPGCNSLMVLGPGRSGKDTLADMFVRLYGYKYTGSSSVVLCNFIYPEDPLWMYDNRHTYKIQLFKFGNLIRAIDPSFIPWSILQNGSELLVGLRSKYDIQAAIDSCVSKCYWLHSDVPDDPTMDFDFLWLEKACKNKIPLHILNNIKTTNKDGLYYLEDQLRLLVQLDGAI